MSFDKSIKSFPFEDELRRWTNMANDLAVRDKSVKAIQYGARMILWFYGDKWSSETKASLLATQNAGSNTRKLCRLLKSFDYVYMIQQSLKKKNYIYASGIDHGNADINGTNEYGQVLTEHEEKLLNSMSIITQALWVLFMYYDNQIVLTRLKLFPQILGLDPKVPDRHSNKFWFAADMCTLGTACYRYYLYSSKYEARVSELKCKVHEGCTLSSNLDFHGELNELRRLHKKRKDSCIWQIMKAVVDCGLSSSMDPILAGERLFGPNMNMPQSCIGLLGVTSALMNIVDGWYRLGAKY